MFEEFQQRYPVSKRPLPSKLNHTMDRYARKTFIKFVWKEKQDEMNYIKPKNITSSSCRSLVGGK